MTFKRSDIALRGVTMKPRAPRTATPKYQVDSTTAPTDGEHWIYREDGRWMGMSRSRRDALLICRALNRRQET